MPLVSKKAAVFLLLTLVLLCALAYLVYSVYLSPTGIKKRENSDLGKVDDTIPPKFLSLNGEEISFGEYEGKLLVVTLWASWSPFTQQELSVMATLKREFGDRITIRAVNRKEDTSTALAYLETIGREEGIEYIIDANDQLYAQMGGYAMPETIVFDEVGNEIERVRGTVRIDELRTFIESRLSLGD
jgi:thiol-disulfide isomerase/thioredoxin